MSKEYEVKYWRLEENLPVGEAGDMMATLYCSGHVVTTINVDHVLYEHLDKGWWMK